MVPYATILKSEVDLEPAVLFRIDTGHCRHPSRFWTRSLLLVTDQTMKSSLTLDSSQFATYKYTNQQTIFINNVHK